MTYGGTGPRALTIRVHNVGSVGVSGALVTAYAGLDVTGTAIGSAQTGPIDAPLDLVPRSETVTIPYEPGALPVAVTVVVAPTAEITHENNVATAWIGGAAPDLPPPMLLALSPLSAPAGSEVEVLGAGLQAGATALSSESASPALALDVHDAEHATLRLGAALPAGVQLVSVRNPDGKQSNLLPLTVTD